MASSGMTKRSDGIIAHHTTHTRFKCRFCGAVLPAWLPVVKRPNGAMLLYHLGQNHPDRVKAYLDQMPSDENHDRVVVQAFAGVKDREREKP